jgi:hypothetical protein
MNWTVFWFNPNGRLKVEEVGRQIALMVRGADVGTSNGKKAKLMDILENAALRRRSRRKS